MSVKCDVAPWRDDASFVYSMTYDEATIDAVTNSYPIHQEYDVPGHVCAVSGYLGTERLPRGTSMREVFHMSGEQLRFLIERGWTVSSHSHTHCPTDQIGIDLDLEVRVSKWELEKATGYPIRILTYWNNLALAEQILPMAKESGYLGVLSIGYPFSDADFNEWDIGRGTIARDLDGWLKEPLLSMYNHTRSAFPGELTREKTRGKWLVDLTHIVADRLPRACPESLWNRCITPEILETRLREVRDLWGNDLWAAVPEDVVEYRLLERATRIEVVEEASDTVRCRVSTSEVHPGVQSRELTFRAHSVWSGLEVNGGKYAVTKKDGYFVWTAPVEPGGATEFLLRCRV